MEKYKKRIILEFTPEEIKLLAYGAIPRSVKERLTEIAYYIDDTERTIAVFKEKEREKKNFEKQKKKQRAKKRYNCQLLHLYTRRG